MRALLPFLRLFKFAKLPLFLGLVLMITGLASSIGLLTTSGWFLAATAIAGLGTLFNFFYPSASVQWACYSRTLSVISKSWSRTMRLPASWLNYGYKFLRRLFH